MPKTKFATLSKHITIRLSDKEIAKLEEYCEDNKITMSDYFRGLLRVHLGFADDLQILYKAPPRPKK